MNYIYNNILLIPQNENLLKLDLSWRKISIGEINLYKNQENQIIKIENLMIIYKN